MKTAKDLKLGDMVCLLDENGTVGAVAPIISFDVEDGKKDKPFNFTVKVNDVCFSYPVLYCDNVYCYNFAITNTYRFAFFSVEAAIGYFKKKIDLIDESIARLKTLEIQTEHVYVEIGGIKWATMNVGAKTFADAGLYFAWGETRGYSADEVGKNVRFAWETYKFYNPKNGQCELSDYNDKDGLTVLKPQDDPVTANWGGKWRLPTKKEFETLNAATYQEFIENYKGSGINGLLLTDKTDPSKVLFFPAAGCGDDESVSLVGLDGHYWSSSLYESAPTVSWYLHFSGSRCVGQKSFTNYRHYGYCVRGVLG